MKRIISIVLLSAMLVASVFTVISCGDSSDNCSHIYVTSSVTKEPTCTESGSQIVKCSYCGDLETESIPALGHNIVNGECTICGE